MSEKRFAALADSDIQKLVEDKDSVNTKRQVKLSKKLFLQFIGEIDADMAAVLKMECRLTVSVIDKTSLDKYLGQFTPMSGPRQVISRNHLFCQSDYRFL